MNNQSSNIVDKVDIERPPLYLQLAYDLCRYEISRLGGRIVILSPNLMVGYELARRTNAPVDIIVSNIQQSEYIDDFSSDTGLINGNIHHISDLNNFINLPGVYRAIVWGFPQNSEFKEISTKISSIAESTEILMIIGTTVIYKFLTSSNGNPYSTDLGFSPTFDQIFRYLRKLSPTRLDVQGFHGPVSLSIGFLARLSLLTGRTDLADRLNIYLRQIYLVKDWKCRFSPIWIFKAYFSD